VQPSLTLDLINPQVAGQPARKHLPSIIQRSPPLLAGFPRAETERDSSINAAAADDDYGRHP